MNMNGFDQREYQTVIPAALLHDVGKFLLRGGGEYDCSHQEASFRFVEKHKDKLANSNYEIEDVLILVRHHHTNRKDFYADPLMKAKSSEKATRLWNLLRVIKRADSYSCGERDIAEPRRRDMTNKEKPLNSLFSRE